MPNKAQNSNNKKKYDLEERTAQFGEAIIELVKTFPNDPINSPLISQIVRAGTSIGETIWKQMEQSPRKISTIEFLSVKEKQRRLSIG